MVQNVIIIVGAALILIAIPIFMRKSSWKKMIAALDEGNYDRYYQIIDSFACKMTFSAFDRENMRLSGYIAQNRKDDIENLFKMMMHMRIKSKQKITLGTRGFYYYLEQGRVKRARDMIDFVKANGPESTYKDLELQYSILLKKESKYINEIKEKINAIWNGKDPLDGDKKMVVGTFQYLLGLQYSYKNDLENMNLYFGQALENVAGTPYEENIKNILKEKNL